MGLCEADGLVLAGIQDDLSEDWSGGKWRRSRDDCKKMQKKCKKMQKYLHMSKKSSTFVADLGIVPAITI